MYSSDMKAPRIKSKGETTPLFPVLYYLHKTVVRIIIVILLLNVGISCVWDPEPNGYAFTVENMTEDSLIIVSDEIIPNYTVQVSNYNYIKSFPNKEVYNVYYQKASDTVFTIPPHAMFFSSISWESRDRLSDTPEGDGITPAWKFIKRIEIAGNPVSPEIWNSAQKWSISSEYENIERVYTLTFKGVIESLSRFK